MNVEERNRNVNVPIVLIFLDTKVISKLMSILNICGDFFFFFLIKYL